MLVRVKSGLSHAHYSAGDVFEASPAEMLAFGDKFEAGYRVGGDSLPDNFLATPAAVLLADKHDVDLGNIIGTGAEGKITVTDVRKVLPNDGND